MNVWSNALSILGHVTITIFIACFVFLLSMVVGNIIRDIWIGVASYRRKQKTGAFRMRDRK
jgi:hypothetical protein